jgi:RNA polymerase sigma-70 factor, ECF subfamily
VQSRAVSTNGVDWQTLSARLARSDPDAFELLFRQFRGRLVAFVSGILHDSEAAHDVVQDVFAELWEMRAEIDASQSLRAFLYRMARNRAYNLVRDRRIHAVKHEQIRSGSASEGTLSNGIDDALDARLLGESVRRWLDDLPERQRDALRLSRFEGLSHAEIAKVMEISPRTVNNHIVRALSTLDERLRRFRAVTQ